MCVLALSVLVRDSFAARMAGILLTRDNDGDTQDSSATNHTSNGENRPTDSDVEKTATDGRKMTLAEAGALEHARASPNDDTPLYICFGDDDKDCPRNFSKAKKWYITLVVRWLNFA